jgi:flagellar motor switch protein FliG
MADSQTSSLKDQGKAALILVSLGIIAVLGMVVIEQFRTVVSAIATIPAATNTTIQTALTAFVAGLALFGTFATVTALIIVVKGIIGIVKGMQ